MRRGWQKNMNRHEDGLSSLPRLWIPAARRLATHATLNPLPRRPADAVDRITRHHRSASAPPLPSAPELLTSSPLPYEPSLVPVLKFQIPINSPTLLYYIKSNQLIYVHALQDQQAIKKGMRCSCLP